MQFHTHSSCFSANAEQIKTVATWGVSSCPGKIISRVKIEDCDPKQDLQGKSVAIIGLGKSGIAATKLALARGASSVVALDQNEKLTPLEGNLLGAKDGNLKTILGSFDPRLLDLADVIVVSPGIHLENYGLTSRILSGKHVKSELDFAAEVLPRCTKILAITGTNGKSTVTFAGQVAVVEVSSYQLEIQNKCFCPSVAVILNLTPDHLERHKTMTNYAMIKCQVLSHMRGRKFALLPTGNPYINEAIKCYANESNFAWIGAYPSVQVDMHGKIANFNVPEIGLVSQLLMGAMKTVGTHNYYNAAVAALSVIALDVGIDCGTITSAIGKLQPPPHRMQIVHKDACGITWVNGSKATNGEATYAGLTGLTDMRAVILLGGLAKVSNTQGGSNGFEQLIELLKYHRVL